MEAKSEAGTNNARPQRFQGWREIAEITAKMGVGCQFDKFAQSRDGFHCQIDNNCTNYCYKLKLCSNDNMHGNGLKNARCYLRKMH